MDEADSSELEILPCVFSSLLVNIGCVRMGCVSTGQMEAKEALEAHMKATRRKLTEFGIRRWACAVRSLREHGVLLDRDKTGRRTEGSHPGFQKDLLNNCLSSSGTYRLGVLACV